MDIDLKAEERPQHPESVRRYFAKLALGTQAASALDHWSALPVEQYFVAMRMPSRFLNVERRPCSEVVEPLGSLFANIKWG